MAERVNRPFTGTHELDDSWQDPVEWKRPLLNSIKQVSGFNVLKTILGSAGRTINRIFPVDPERGSTVD